MAGDISTKPELLTLMKLYEHESKEQQEKAHELWVAYLQLITRIHSRIRSDPEAYARFRALTEKEGRRSMKSVDPISSPNPLTTE